MLNKEQLSCAKCQLQASQSCKDCALSYCIKCSQSRHAKGSFASHQLVDLSPVVNETSPDNQIQSPVSTVESVKPMEKVLCEECAAHAAVLSCTACELVLCTKCCQEIHLQGTMQNHLRDGHFLFFDESKPGFNNLPTLRLKEKSLSVGNEKDVKAIGSGLAKAIFGASSSGGSFLGSNHKSLDQANSPTNPKNLDETYRIWNSWNVFPKTSPDRKNEQEWSKGASGLACRHSFNEGQSELSNVTRKYGSLSLLASSESKSSFLQESSFSNFDSTRFLNSWSPSPKNRSNTKDITNDKQEDQLETASLIVQLCDLMCIKESSRQLMIQNNEGGFNSNDIDSLIKVLKGYGQVGSCFTELASYGLLFASFSESSSSFALNSSTLIEIQSKIEKNVQIRFCEAFQIALTDKDKLRITEFLRIVSQIQNQSALPATISSSTSSGSTTSTPNSPPVSPILNYPAQRLSNEKSSPVLSSFLKPFPTMYNDNFPSEHAMQANAPTFSPQLKKSSSADNSAEYWNISCENKNTHGNGTEINRSAVYPVSMPKNNVVPMGNNYCGNITSMANLNGRNDQGCGEYSLVLSKITNGGDNRTTLMIRNIPNKYTQQMLLGEINRQHAGTYDFFYLPIDFKNKCNMGYAFINFMKTESILPFVLEFDKQKWTNFNSEKVCAISYARLQGKQAMIARFQNSSLLEKHESYRPLVFYSNGLKKGLPEPFPAAEAGNPQKNNNGVSAPNSVHHPLYAESNKSQVLLHHHHHSNGGGHHQHLVQQHLMHHHLHQQQPPPPHHRPHSRMSVPPPPPPHHYGSNMCHPTPPNNQCSGVQQMYQLQNLGMLNGVNHLMMPPVHLLNNNGSGNSTRQLNHQTDKLFYQQQYHYLQQNNSPQQQMYLNQLHLANNNIPPNAQGGSFQNYYLKNTEISSAVDTSALMMESTSSNTATSTAFDSNVLA